MMRCVSVAARVSVARMRQFAHLAPGSALLLLIAVLSAGCNGVGRPTMRMGALPFPGLGLYEVADPADLGRHNYWTLFQFADGEVSRGVVYTERAGFLDVAHVRDTADWTAYYASAAARAMRAGDRHARVGGPDRTRVHLRFDYPPGWDDLTDRHRRRLIPDLAVRAGQEAAYAVATWHELLTWYDHGVLPFVSEKHSAFTVDDVMGHVVGLRVAGRALRDTSRDYADAVAHALATELRDLDARPPDGTRRAVGRTKGHWWERGTGLKRHLDLGLDDGLVRPMLVHATVEPEQFPLPRVADATTDLDLADFFRVELESHLRLYDRELRPKLAGDPTRIRPRRDIPRLMEFVRAEMRDEIGPNVDVVDSPLIDGQLALGDGEGAE